MGFIFLLDRGHCDSKTFIFYMMDGAFIRR